VAARFDALGAWSIGEGCETTSRTMPDGKIVMTTSHITDSGELYIGRTVGRVSSAYTCNAPRSRTGTSEGRAALSIYDYFLEVMKKSGGPPAA
jgi:hypothetical protein